MRHCTRRGCTSTAVAFPKLSFRDAAQNQTNAILRLAVCSEHMPLDKSLYLAQVAWPAVQRRHSEHYGLMPILDETVLSYVALESVEGQTFLALLEERERPPLVALPKVEEVSNEEFRRLLRESKRSPP